MEYRGYVKQGLVKFQIALHLPTFLNTKFNLNSTSSFGGELLGRRD
jgi:hypothetical protein